MFYRFLRILWALLLACLIWWIGPLISIGVYRPLGWMLFRQFLVATVLIWGFWPLLVFLWNRLGMGMRQFPMAPSVRSMNALTGRLKDLDRQLKVKWLRQPRSKLQHWLGCLSKEHRQILPWYLVIGPEGSGKTSWVTQLPTQDVAYPKTDAEVNFWITHAGVWFDTPGRWMAGKGMSDGDQQTWYQLLQGLQNLRNACVVVNGVVLCIDIVYLLHESLEDRKRLAESIRERLIDTQEKWGTTVNVYLVLTGLDKVPGASEMLSLMDAQQLSRGLGFALPLACEHSADLHAQWRQAFSEMETRVQTQLLFQVAQGTKHQGAGQLLMVESMARLRAPLFDFLQMVMLGPGLLSHAALRGVWLGSMMGESSDYSLVNDETRETDSLNLSLLWVPVQQQILLEQNLSARVNSIGGHQGVMRLVRNTLLAVFSGFLMVWLTWGFWAETNHLEEVSAQFSEGRRLAAMQMGQGSEPVSPLLEVASQMRYALAQLEGTDRFLPTPFFEHSKIEAVAAATYQRHLHKTLMPELHNQVKKVLQTQIKNGRGDVYQTLKIYLMLARPDRRSSTDLERWINEHWQDLSLGMRSSEEDRSVLLVHSRALFTQVNIPGTPEDAHLVQEARARAAQTPSVTRVLQHVKSLGLPASSPDVSLSRAAGLASSMALRLRSNAPSTEPSIPGWYTRSGYTDVVAPRLRTSSRKILEEDAWVLRDEPFSGNTFELDKTVEKLSDAARSQFLQDYIRRWHFFLSDVAARHVSGLEDAAQIASLFVDPQSPLALLVRFAARETTLTGNFEGDVDSWIDRQKLWLERSRRAIVGEISGEHFRSKLLPEHLVEDQFDPLRRFALQMNQSQSAASTNPLSRLFEPLSMQLGLVNGALMSGQIMPEYNTFTRLRNEATRQPEPLRSVMLDLISSGSSMTTKQSQAVLSRNAAGVTKVMCDQGLNTRYPFSRAATSDMGVQDFEQMFGPQGLMATHFRDQLVGFIDTSSTPWRVRSTDPSQFNLISPDVLRSYETADRIRAAMLDSGGRLKLAAMIRFVDMDSQIAESQLDISGQVLRYAHGSSAPRNIDWQAHVSNSFVALHVRGVDGRTDTIRFDGPWALLKFFDAGKTPGGGSDRRETFHHSRLGRVHIEWQAVTTPSPIWSDLLTNFRCPR